MMVIITIMPKSSIVCGRAMDICLLQALDSNFTDDNRRKCAEAAKPLLNAVDELTTFASSPEFASVPAKISHKVKKRTP